MIEHLNVYSMKRLLSGHYQHPFSLKTGQDASHSHAVALGISTRIPEYISSSALRSMQTSASVLPKFNLKHHLNRARCCTVRPLSSKRLTSYIDSQPLINPGQPHGAQVVSSVPASLKQPSAALSLQANRLAAP